MHDAVAEELRLCQGRDHGEDPLLLGKAQMGLEAHQIVHRPGGVVPPQLHHGVGLLPGFGVRQAHGLQGAEAQGVLPPPGHDLHGHTALEDLGVLKAVDRGLLRGGQGPDEGLVLGLVHGTVDIIRSPPVIAGGEPGLAHVDGLRAHQGRRGVEEVQILRPAEVLGNGPGQGLRGQGTGGEDDGTRGESRKVFRCMTP